MLSMLVIVLWLFGTTLLVEYFNVSTENLFIFGTVSGLILDKILLWFRKNVDEKYF